jgi:antitoxin PrlF
MDERSFPVATATLTSKGQVTIPKDVRSKLGLRPGDRITFVEENEGFVMRRCVDESPFDKYVGILAPLAGQDPDALVEDMRGQ